MQWKIFIYRPIFDTTTVVDSTSHHQKSQITRQSFTPFKNFIGKASPNGNKITSGLHYNNKYVRVRLRRRVDVDIWRPLRRVGPGCRVTLALSFFVLYCICQYIDEVNEENWQNVLININFCQYFTNIL